MLQYLKTFKLHSCSYVLENGPPLGDSRLAVLATWQQIRAWIGELVQVDVVAVDSCAHYFRWVWTNLAPPIGASERILVHSKVTHMSNG